MGAQLLELLLAGSHCGMLVSCLRRWKESEPRDYRGCLVSMLSRGHTCATSLRDADI